MENDYTEEEEEYTEDKVIDMLLDALYDNNTFGEARICTFEEAGVLTNDKGLLIKTGEQKIYITVQIQ